MADITIQVFSTDGTPAVGARLYTSEDTQERVTDGDGKYVQSGLPAGWAKVVGHSIGEKLLFVQPSLTTVEIA